jgi:hypothetical protein
MSLVGAFLAIVGINVSPAKAQELVIDDFMDSPYTSPAFVDQPTWVTRYQTGPNILGGVRQTNVTISQGTPKFFQSSRLQIRPEGSMVFSGGYKSFFGLLLSYGYTATGGAHLLDLDLSLDGTGADCPRCDHFRINFDGSDSEMGYLMQVLDRNGHYAMMSGPVSLAGRGQAFFVDFPFAEFEEDPAFPVDWHHIDYIYVLFQSGNVLGGHDFAVTKITAAPPSASGAVR